MEMTYRHIASCVVQLFSLYLRRFLCFKDFSEEVDIQHPLLSNLLSSVYESIHGFVHGIYFQVADFMLAKIYQCIFQAIYFYYLRGCLKIK